MLCLVSGRVHEGNTHYFISFTFTLMSLRHADHASSAQWAKWNPPRRATWRCPNQCHSKVFGWPLGKKQGLISYLSNIQQNLKILMFAGSMNVSYISKFQVSWMFHDSSWLLKLGIHESRYPFWNDRVIQHQWRGTVDITSAIHPTLWATIQKKKHPLHQKAK